MARKALTQLDLNSNRIINVGAPSLGSDATTKTYVDGKEVPLTFSAPLVRTVNNVDVVPNVDFNFSTSQTIVLTDVSTTTMVTVLTVSHNSSGGAGAIGLGAGIAFAAESSTTIDTLQGRIHARWTDATHATRASKMTLTTVLNAVENDSLVLYPSGGAGFDGAADPLAGHIGLPSGGGVLIGGIDSSLPTGGATGTVLAKQSATNFDTGWETPASYQGASATTTAVTSVAAPGAMAGLTGTITPSVGGRIMISCTGVLSNTGAGTSIAQIRYGTGTKPANGAAASGTAVGGILSRPAAGANVVYPCCLTAIVTGLTPGTAYWIDLALYGSTSGAQAVNCAMTALEF